MSIVIVDVQVHQELNEHNVEQQTSNGLEMMLVQKAKGALTEVSTVFVIRLQSENSWDVFALS